MKKNNGLLTVITATKAALSKVCIDVVLLGIDPGNDDAAPQG